MGLVVRFFRGTGNPTTDFAQISKKSFKTPEEAEKARQVSGDIVCDEETGLPCTSQKWLWDFEKKDPNCYAQRMRRYAMQQLNIQ